MFKVAKNGTLENIANSTNSNTLEHSGAKKITTIKINEITYLFVSGVSGDGISVFQVSKQVGI